MRKICAWCGKQLDPPVGALPEDALVSHGICEKCFSFLVQNDRHSITGFLDRFAFPVLLIDDHRTVLMANESARRAFPAAAWRTVPRDPLLIGNVIECAHAGLPEGCGATIHCGACQVRSSVDIAFRTGQSQAGVEAFLSERSGETRKRIRVSTERLGRTVLLRLEPAGTDTTGPGP